MHGDKIRLPDQPRFHWPEMPEPKNDQEVAELYEWCISMADVQDFIASVSESDADLRLLDWIR